MQMDQRLPAYGTYCIGPWTLWCEGAPQLYRQHNGDSDDDVIDLADEDVKPKKKKSRR